MKRIDYDDTVRQLIFDSYREGKSTRVIAENVGVSFQTINRFLKREGVVLRTTKETSRRYSFNTSFFNKIDNEEKAYWLGFIYADGYLIENQHNGLGITLGIKDKNHLVKFNESLSSNHPVKEYRGKSAYSKSGFVNFCRVHLMGEEVKNQVKKLGVIPNKTKFLTFPNDTIISSNLISHFIRGYFDGDGCIHLDKSNCFRVILAGQKVFLDVIVEKLNIKEYTMKERQGCFELQINKQKNMNDFLSKIYSNSTIYLDRKYNLFITGLR